MRRNDRVVHNLSDFVRKLVHDIQECGQPVWFRGQASKDWKLVPSIARNPDIPPEMNLIKKFKQSASILLNPLPTNLIDWLFIMQHHGAPTRLLDWTESPLVASYFAADNVKEDISKDGVVWALLPVELNKLANIYPDYSFDIPSFSEDKVTDTYSPESFAGELTSNLSPLAIMAPRNSARMQIQLSVFTINHRNNTPIENTGDKHHVWRYIIPEADKASFKDDLKYIGLGRFQLFPELQSIGDLLRP